VSAVQQWVRWIQEDETGGAHHDKPYFTHFCLVPAKCTNSLDFTLLLGGPNKHIKLGFYCSNSSSSSGGGGGGSGDGGGNGGGGTVVVIVVNFALQ
jgi:hypothetical protein